MAPLILSCSWRRKPSPQVKKPVPCESRHLPVMSISGGLPPDIVMSQSHGSVSVCLIDLEAHEITKTSDRIINKVKNDLIDALAKNLLQAHSRPNAIYLIRTASPNFFKREPDIVHRIFID